MLIRHGALVVDVKMRGTGGPVLLLHSAGLGATQWHALMRELECEFCCAAPNQRGYGQSSPWPAGVPSDLAAELALLEAVVAQLPGPVHIVGHSMGAWLALNLVRRDTFRFATMTLIEPVALGVLRSEHEAAALAEVSAMIEDMLDAFAGDNVNAAMERFTDYWYGEGAWARIPFAQRLPIHARAGKLHSDIRAIWADTIPLAEYAVPDMPCLVVSAEATTPAAQRMAQLLAERLCGGRREILASAGHMAPVTHAPALAAMLRAHLAAARHQ